MFYNYEFQVFHKIITGGLSRIQPMYDCLLTVLVNGMHIHYVLVCNVIYILSVSPYLKSLSMITCTRLMHLMEVSEYVPIFMTNN